MPATRQPDPNDPAFDIDPSWPTRGDLEDCPELRDAWRFADEQSVPGLTVEELARACEYQPEF